MHYTKHGYEGTLDQMELASGETYETAVRDPHGMPSDPCTEEERIDKFVRLASYVLSSAGVSDAIGTVRQAERLASVRELTALLRPR